MKLVYVLFCLSATLILSSCTLTSSITPLVEAMKVDSVVSKNPSEGGDAQSPTPGPTPVPDQSEEPAPTPNPLPPSTPQPEPGPTPQPGPLPPTDPGEEPGNPTPTPTPVPPQPELPPVPVPPEPVPEPQPQPEPEPEPTPTPAPTPTPTPTPTPRPPVGEACPNNYEYVAANSVLRTAAFCIAKFEMKMSVNQTALSVPSGRPWLANRATASQACAALGVGYRLPTNAEWNAVALEVYNNEDNWTKGRVSKGGTLYTGFYSGWTEPIAVTDEKNPYNGTGKSDGIERRTFYLANGKVIWDFGGNAWEWVSDSIYGSSYKPDLSGSYVRAYHNNKWDFPAGSQQLFDFTGMSSVENRDVYLGQMFGGQSGRVLRGGAVCIHSVGVTGIFAANIGDITANEMQAPASWNLKMNNVGFRCVTQPVAGDTPGDDENHDEDDDSKESRGKGKGQGK